MMTFSIYGKIQNVRNHQPDDEPCEIPSEKGERSHASKTSLGGVSSGPSGLHPC